MKRIYSYLLVMTMLVLCGGRAMAQSVTIGGVVYTVDGDHAYVSGNSGVGDTVVVLGTVTIDSVEYSVTEIGNQAFYNKTNIVSVTLPDGIVSIGSNAFESCSNLISINLGKGLESINTYAFRYCRKLLTIEFPEGLKSIGGYAFSTCESFTTIEVPDGVISLGNCVFEYCYNLKSITLPKGITDLQSHTFWDCNRLESIVIPEGVTIIGQEAFYSCDKLATVVLPKSLTSIEYRAFYSCSSLKTIQNSSYLQIQKGSSDYGYVAYYAQQVVNVDTIINNFYFYTDGNGKHHLTYYEGTDTVVTLPANYEGEDYCIGENAFYGRNEIDTIVLPETVTSIGASAFYNCSSLSAINIPSGVTSIGNNAFYGCSSLDTIVLPDNLSFVGNNAFAGTNIVFPDENGICYVGQTAYSLTDRTLTEYVLKEGTESVNAGLFSNCSNVKSISIPSSVEYIGDNAFAYCYALDSVYYNAANCTSTSSDLFYSCSSLKKVTFGNDVKVIPSNLFYDRTSLQTVEMGDSVVKIGDQAFYNCQSLQSINIPNSVDTIGNNVFYNCVSLPVEGNIRYADCYALSVIDKNQTSYTLKENTRFLGTELFRDCSSMTSVNIPSGVSALGDHIFYGCSALTSLTLPEAVSSIGSYAFYNCSALTSVNIPSGVPSIGDYAFYNCSSLTSLTLPETVTSIGSHAFYNCLSMASVNVPSGVPSIGDHTFYNCSSLTSLTLPETVTSIGSYAFYNCSSMASVNVPSGVPTIGDYTFYNCNLLTSLTLPETVTSIGNNAFYNCYLLASLNVPSRVATIGSSAFYNCYSLAAMTIPASVTSIADAAFYGCTGIMDLTFEDGGQTLSLGRRDYANGLFRSCPLRRLYIGRNLSYNANYSYGYSPFYQSASLYDVTIGDSVTSIGSYAFNDCNALTYLNISTGVTAIGDYAFQSCELLRDIELPSTIETIGYNNLDQSYINLVSHAVTPPTISGGCSGKVIYVPSGSGDAYRELYPDNIIIDGDGVTVVVEITEEDTLSVVALTQVDQLADINHLVVRGTLDDTDISCIKNSMTNLITLDMSGLNMNEIPASFFKENRKITKITLPEKATAIGYSAFRDCSRLKEIIMPDTLQQIGSEAFYQANLKEVTIPQNVTTIGSYAFYNCDKLRTVNIPSRVKRLEEYMFYDCLLLSSVELSDSLTYIGNYAFSNCPSISSIVLPDAITQINTRAFSGCTSLASVNFPEGLTTIGNYAFRECALDSVVLPSSLNTLGTYSFYDCNRLRSVTLHGVSSIGEYSFASCENLKEANLPATLISCGNYIFNGCEQLATVTCRALFPPTLSSIAPNNTCVLYAPEWTFSKYKIVSGWSAFKTIRPISGVYPDDIIVYKEENLALPDEGLPEDYKPNLLVTVNSTAGKLTLRGTTPLALSHYEMQQSRSTSTMTSLINKVDLSADSVITKMTLSTGTWHYLTFPYDVKVSDIVTDGNWIICYYDGEARAKAELDSTWRTVPYDSILHAGEGYIWHSNNSDFTVPAMRNDNRSLIFAKDTRNIQLKEHVASTTANSGWNLIGNPYPCYYDTRFMDFSSPITIRNGNSYAAYSPIDDSYILKPNEAFFVQCSAGNDSIAFAIDGRQVDNTVRSLTLAPQRVRKVDSDRSVFNLYLESDNFAEHARFVINEEASYVYEFACDAAKFMSEDATVQQLFIIENDERMAINERPLGNGEITLGVYFGKEGNYNFALDTRVTDMEVVLLDKYTGVETDLLTGSYVFNTEVGTFTDRFVIRVKRIGGIADAIEIVPAAEVNVIAQSGAIYITNATAPIYVYNASGALVTTENGNEVTLVVAPGIYIVKVDGEIHKVSVVE